MKFGMYTLGFLRELHSSTRCVWEAVNAIFDGGMKRKKALCWHLCMYSFFCSVEGGREHATSSLARSTPQFWDVEATLYDNINIWIK